MKVSSDPVTLNPRPDKEPNEDAFTNLIFNSGVGLSGNAGIPSQRPPEWVVYILVNTVPRVSKFHLSEERILNSIKDPHISRYHTILYYAFTMLY